MTHMDRNMWRFEKIKYCFYSSHYVVVGWLNCAHYLIYETHCDVLYKDYDIMLVNLNWFLSFHMQPCKF
jgi:hypothetical protein